MIQSRITSISYKQEAADDTEIGLIQEKFRSGGGWTGVCAGWGDGHLGQY